jgi:ankyrin repeat protein
MANALKMWAHGIALPRNPTKIKLHQAVFRGDTKFIERACLLKLNSPIYCHINEADALGLTPLMLAVYLKKESIFSELIVLGANPFLVPLTRF